MSISLALNNALSGLNVTSRGVEIVSDNVANAQTQGYAARELVVSSRNPLGTGHGAQIDGIRRRVDHVLRLDRAQSDAALHHAETRTNALAEMARLIGDPTQSGSLAQRVNLLSSDLVEASSRPDSLARLERSVQSASALADGLNTASKGVQSIREAADRAIAQDVALLNASLKQIQAIDAEIIKARRNDSVKMSLLDQRQAVMDQIAPILPIRELVRENGTIALYTTGGTLLYDGRPAEISFSPTQVIMPDLTEVTEDLSRLSIDGVTFGTTSRLDRISGGRLSANFEVRDSIAPAVQSKLDAFARDLVERFQDPQIDDTLQPGAAGLLTDGGAAFDPVNETGLAGRIAVNSLVLETEGGAAWRMRDGLQASVQGEAGDNSRLSALAARLTEARPLQSGTLSGASMSVAENIAEIASLVATRQLDEGRTLAFEQARNTGLREAELRNGVDTDDEMRRLLVLEQAYAANARVISVIDDLMENLLRL